MDNFGFLKLELHLICVTTIIVLANGQEGGSVEEIEKNYQTYTKLSNLYYQTYTKKFEVERGNN